MVTDVSASLSWCLSAVLMFRAWFFVRFKFQHYFRVSSVAKIVRTQVWRSCVRVFEPLVPQFWQTRLHVLLHISSAPPSLVVWRRRRRKRRRKRRRRRKSPSVDPWFHLGPWVKTWWREGKETIQVLGFNNWSLKSIPDKTADFRHVFFYWFWSPNI